MRAFIFLLLVGAMLPQFTVAQRKAGSVEVRNQTGAQINLLYVTPPTKGWGNDVLGTDVYLQDQAQHTVNLSSWGSSTCVFDIKASDENSNEYYLWGKNLCTTRQISIDSSHLLVRGSTPESEAPVQQEGESTTFRNTTEQSVYYLYAVPASRADVGEIEWGTDLLGDGTLSAGDTFEARIEREGECYFDIKAEASEHVLVQVLRRVNLCDNEVVSIGTEAAEPSGSTFEIRNGGTETIYYLKISPAGENNFGDDLLADGVLSADETLTLTVDAPGCNVDILAEASGNKEIVTLRNVDICSGETIVIEDNEADMITVKNGTARTVYYLYISNSTANWGDDVLGSEVITSNQEERVRFTGASGNNCRFNVKAEGENHALIKTIRNVNLCTTREITIR